MRLTLDLAGRLEPEAIDPVFRDRLVAAFQSWAEQR
jgi:hypothetical protein